MNRLLLYTWAALLLFFSTSDAVQAQISTINGKTIDTAAIDRFLQVKMDSFNIPGLSIAIVNDGKIVYQRALGYANLAAGIKTDSNTQFEAASMSKTVFAFFVLQMAEKGLLSLDVPLYTYLPYPDIAYDNQYKLITARMALSHTTGMPNWREYSDPPPGRNIKKGKLFLQFKPGTNFSYSGEAYQYLVKVVAHLLHTDLTHLGDIVSRQMLRPIGMQHASFSWNSYLAKHLATGYKQENDSAENVPGERKEFREFSAAGGLRTNAIDFAHFMITLMQEKVLSKNSYQQMFRPTGKPKDTGWIADNGEAWGLGLAIKTTPWGTRYLHSGNNGDFTCYYALYKEKKSGFVFLTNCNRAGDLFEQLEPYLTTGKEPPMPAAK